MYTATVQLTIKTFVPMNGVIKDSASIDAIIAPPVNTSPQPQTDVFSGDGQSITITVPKGYIGSVGLTYQLPSSAYVLLGVSFKSLLRGAGRVEFPGVQIDRDPTGGQMGVLTSCDPNSAGYSYVILVQEAATGNIGLIDPVVVVKTGQN
jgi:hypothetical protein